MVTTTSAALPITIEGLRTLVLSQQSEAATRTFQNQALLQTLDEYKAENDRLAEYVRLLKSKHFGPSSERRRDPAQFGLFNEAESLLDDDDVGKSKEGDEEDSGEGSKHESHEGDEEIEVPAHMRRRGKRKPLPEALPRTEIVHDLAEHEKMCANDPNHTLVRTGERTCERLVYEPATIEVERHIRPEYACPVCKDGIQCAPRVPSPIPKSMATPSLLAQIVTSKFVDGMPLARQENMFARIGIDLPRSTLASWMIRCGELVSPLLEWIAEEIRKSDYVLADETTFQVLKEEGKTAQSKSYLWALRREDPDRPLLYYAYDPSRSGEVARRLLKGFQGYLQADGYSGYDGFEHMEGIVLVGCFAHARRKFDEAMRGQAKPKKGQPKSDKKRIADQGLAKINALFKIERRYAGVSPEERHRLRQEKLRPKLVELRAWTLEVKDRVPPTSLTGKALTYLDNQWHKLFRVLDDGRIELSTNAVERAIRPFVIGRKGWLFADTPRGATASARLYSLVETAKANGIEPFKYLKQVFTLLAAADETFDIAELLPWRISLPE
jgi:transposase